MKRRRSDLFVIFIAAILVIIILISAYIALQTLSPSGNKTTPSTTIPTTAPPPTEQVVSTSPSVKNPNMPVQYNTSATNKLLDILNNRIPLSQSDSIAKANILSDTQGQSGTVYQN